MVRVIFRVKTTVENLNLVSHSLKSLLFQRKFL